MHFSIKVVFKTFRAGKIHFIFTTVSERETRNVTKTFLQVEEKDSLFFNRVGISAKTVIFSSENVKASKRKHCVFQTCEKENRAIVID